MALRSWTECIEASKAAAYQSGITPLEFAEMSPKEIGEYVAARQEREMQEFKQSAILLDGLATQIRAFFNFKHSKSLTKKDLYPQIFGESTAPQPENVSPERKQKIITDKWKAFLGV